MSSEMTAAFVAALKAEAATAERVAGESVDRWFRMAGLTLRFRFLGSNLVPIMTPSFGHLAIAPQAGADQTIHCWDCSSLEMDLPAAPVPMEAFTPRGEIRGLDENLVNAAFDRFGRMLSVYDLPGKEAFFCVGEASAIPRFERAEPIRGLLSWFMRRHGRQLIHAGAVGFADGGVLLIGRSGAGKSNTALGILNSDLRLASDDFCAFSVDDTPTAFSIYSSAKTMESDWDRHPFLRDLAPDIDPLGDKIIYFLNDTVPEKLIANFPLKAILLLRRGGETCGFRPVADNDALSACASDTARLLPGAGPEVLHNLARLIRRLPCFELQLGPDPNRIPSTIIDLLAALHTNSLQPA